MKQLLALNSKPEAVHGFFHEMAGDVRRVSAGRTRYWQGLPRNVTHPNLYQKPRHSLFLRWRNPGWPGGYLTFGHPDKRLDSRVTEARG